MPSQPTPDTTNDYSQLTQDEMKVIALLRNLEAHVWVEITLENKYPKRKIKVKIKDVKEHYFEI